MAREKSLNPAQAQHKKDKANAIKKAKAERTQRLTEKLSKRNPDRIARQIQNLKELESEGKLQGPDRKLLGELEKQLALIYKIRKIKPSETDPKEKKETDSGDRHQNKSGVYVIKGLERRSIYWDPVFNPTGLPPDGYPYQEWNDGDAEVEVEYRPDLGELDASGIPLPVGPALRYRKIVRQEPQPDRPQEPEPVGESKTTYEAAPIVRDLLKESAAFVPASVARRS